MKRNKVSYCVDSPWTDRSNGKSYPLTKIEIEELKEMTVTKTGKMGRTVVARIHGYNGSIVQDHAVCCPPDVFDFMTGAKIALERALNQTKITKPLRKSIWDGLFASYIPVYPSLRDLDKLAKKEFGHSGNIVERVKAYRRLYPDAGLKEAVDYVKSLQKGVS
jgi:hypothetical protein